MNTGIIKYAFLAAMIFVSTVAQGSTITTLYTPPAGDATYAWNTRYGPADPDYVAGGAGLDVFFYDGMPYGYNYRVGIFEVPIAPLAAGTLLSATLNVNVASPGFYANAQYAKAHIGWVDVGSLIPTGDVDDDNLGPLISALPVLPNDWLIFDDDGDPDGSPGVKSFNVTTHVQDDLNAGRSYSTFVLHTGFPVSGAILSAENGATGPRIVAVTVVPEPAALSLLALGGLALTRRRRVPLPS